MKCFYHNDLDGYASGAIVKSMFPECKMYKINYNMVFPWDIIEEGEDIYMVDFGLQPFNDMTKLADITKLHWIDHHKTSFENAKKYAPIFETVVVEDGKAGCELTWDHFYPDKDMPNHVRYLGRYDVWDHTDPNTLPFQYGMKTIDTDPDEQTLWLLLFSDYFVNDIIDRGKIIMKYEKIQNKNLVNNISFVLISIAGYNAICVNKLFTNSKVFDSIYDPKKHDIMITFGYTGSSWTTSLYSEKDHIDVSEIAKKFGGGGHANASGFQSENVPFFLSQE